MPEQIEPICLGDLQIKSNILEGLCFALDEIAPDTAPKMREAQAALTITVTSLASELSKGLDSYLTFQHDKEEDDNE